MGFARQVGKGAFPITIGRGIAYLINFLIIIISARVLGSYDYGVFSLGVSIMMLLHVVNHFGVETALPYFIPGLLTKNKLGEAVFVYKKILIFRIATSAILGIILFLTGGFISSIYNIPSLNLVLQFLALGLISYSILYLFQSVFQAFKKMSYVMLPDIILAFARFIILIITMYLGLLLITIGYVFAIIITLIITILIAFKKIIPRVKQVSINLKKVKKYSMTIYVSILASYIALNINLLIIGFFPEEAGYLNLAQRIGLFLTLPAISLGVSLFPELSSKLSSIDIKKLFKKITHYSIIISSLASFFGLTVALEMINLLFGSQYINSLMTIQLMMINFFIQGAFTTLATFYASIGRPKKLTVAVIIQALLSIFLTVILIQQKSIGASIAAIISIVFYGFYLSRKTNYPYTTFFKALFTGIVSSSAGLIVLSNYIISFILKTLVYLALFTVIGLVTRLLTKDDFSLLSKSFKYYLSKILR